MTLRFFGDCLDPDFITKVLGVQPISSCRKGDIFHSKVRDRIEKTGAWLYSIDRWNVTLLIDRWNVTLLEDQINQLLDRLPENLNVWHELAANFQADLFCGLSFARSNSGFYLSPETLQRIVDRKLSIGLDIYYHSEEDEQP